MTKTAKQIYSDAMSLPEPERVELAARLLDPFDATRQDDNYAKSWEAEIAKRLRELDSGRVKPIPWEKARTMIRRRGKGDAKAR